MEIENYFVVTSFHVQRTQNIVHSAQLSRLSINRSRPARIVNYILRALNVKAGNHKVVLAFHPQSLKNTETVAYIGYGVLALLIIIGVVVEVRKRTKE